LAAVVDAGFFIGRAVFQPALGRDAQPPHATRSPMDAGVLHPIKLYGDEAQKRQGALPGLVSSIGAIMSPWAGAVVSDGLRGQQT